MRSRIAQHQLGMRSGQRGLGNMSSFLIARRTGKPKGTSKHGATNLTYVYDLAGANGGHGARTAGKGRGGGGPRDSAREGRGVSWRTAQASAPAGTPDTTPRPPSSGLEAVTAMEVSPSPTEEDGASDVRELTLSDLLVCSSLTSTKGDRHYMLAHNEIGLPSTLQVAITAVVPGDPTLYTLELVAENIVLQATHRFSEWRNIYNKVVDCSLVAIVGIIAAEMKAANLPKFPSRRRHMDMTLLSRIFERKAEMELCFRRLLRIPKIAQSTALHLGLSLSEEQVELLNIFVERQKPLSPEEMFLCSQAFFLDFERSCKVMRRLLSAWEREAEVAGDPSVALQISDPERETSPKILGLSPILVFPDTVAIKAPGGQACWKVSCGETGFIECGGKQWFTLERLEPPLRAQTRCAFGIFTCLDGLREPVMFFDTFTTGTQALCAIFRPAVRTDAASGLVKTILAGTITRQMSPSKYSVFSANGAQLRVSKSAKDKGYSLTYYNSDDSSSRVAASVMFEDRGSTVLIEHGNDCLMLLTFSICKNMLDYNPKLKAK